MGFILEVCFFLYGSVSQLIMVVAFIMLYRKLAALIKNQVSSVSSSKSYTPVLATVEELRKINRELSSMKSQMVSMGQRLKIVEHNIRLQRPSIHKVDTYSLPEEEFVLDDSIMYAQLDHVKHQAVNGACCD